MILKIVHRKSVKGTPVLYLYSEQKYLGSLFFADDETCRSLLATLTSHGGGGEYVLGPDQQQSVS